MIYFLTGQELIPKIEYKGQKLIKLVAKKTPPITNKKTPNVPETTLVKNKIDMIIASSTRTILSILPIFFFMIPDFNCELNSTIVHALKM